MTSSGVRRALRAAPILLLLLACDKLLPNARPAGQSLPAPPDASAPVDTPAPPPPAKPVRSRDTTPNAEALAFDQIRRSLRRLVSVEQTFYAENGTYTEDYGRLRYQADGRAEVRFLWLTREGWAASGTHPALPGRDCVIWIGRVNAPPTSLKYIRSGQEGVPACDVSPAPRRSDADPVPPQPRALDTATALSDVSPAVQMKVDMRNLGRAQDAWLGTQGAFSRSVEPFALQYVWHKGVTINILSADKWSWSGRASFAGQPGRTCVVWVGPVPAKPATETKGMVPDRPGVPVCDE